MTIGSSIALLVIGAILAFAVTYEIAGIDITVVGFILMLGGLIGLIFGITTWQRRRVASRTTHVVDEDPPL